MKMVEYILSLAEAKDAKRLPLEGSVTPGKEDDGVYVLTATYEDKAVNGIPSLTATDALILRSSFLRANEAENLRIARHATWQGTHSLQNLMNGALAVYKNIDLTGVKKATIIAYINPKDNPGGTVEIRLDKPDGELLGQGSVTAPAMSRVTAALKPVTGHHDLYIVFKNSEVKDKSMFNFGGLQLGNK